MSRCESCLASLLPKPSAGNIRILIRRLFCCKIGRVAPTSSVLQGCQWPKVSRECAKILDERAEGQEAQDVIDKKFVATMIAHKVSETSAKLDTSLKKVRAAFKMLGMLDEDSKVLQEWVDQHKEIRGTVCCFCILAVITSKGFGKAGTAGKELKKQLEASLDIMGTDNLEITDMHKRVAKCARELQGIIGVVID